MKRNTIFSYYKNIERIKALKNIEELVLDLLQHFSTDAQELLNQSNLIKPLITKLLINEYIKDIDLTTDVKNKITEKFYKSKNLLRSEDIHSFLKSEGKSHKEIVEEACLNKKIKIFSLNKFGKDIDTHFRERKEFLDQYIYSLIRVKDANLANELYFQIEGDEYDFAEIASIYSLGKEKYSRGVIGPRNLTETHPVLRKHLISSKTKVIEYPINIDEYWVITRIEEFWPACLDAKMKDRMSIELFQIEIEKKAKSILMQYKLIKSKSIK